MKIIAILAIVVVVAAAFLAYGVFQNSPATVLQEPSGNFNDVVVMDSLENLISEEDFTEEDFEDLLLLAQ